MPSMSETVPPMPATPSEAEGPTADHHQHDVEEQEAYEYWGYLFKQDKTGTDKLKSLLRGLKDCMNTQYSTDHVHGDKTIDNQPDLTPEQLAHFYRELNGNYDQLFLGTPSESIAFIYKSLGCLHSLQPQSWSQSKAFTDPTVPSLKTEGWIMWQTIQLLLGPDEHSQFIIEAVQKWDIRDPVTGESFPKILPRKCFPTEPDRHMVMWYEGVSERLRKEAEDEERAKEQEAERADVRRLRQRGNVPVSAAANAAADELATPQHLTDDEGSVDSRGPALAYFRNPLYRHVDGRPSIVRRSSKRPALSPRPTMVDKGKEAAATMGHVIRNIGSPNLWDGPRGTSRHSSRDRRRRSTPDHRHPVHYPGDPTPQQIGGAGAYDGPAGGAAGLSPQEQRHRRRRSSQQPEVPVDSGDEAFDADESSAYYSPRPTPPQHPHGHGGHHQHSGGQQHRRAPSDAHRPGSRDSAAAALRHSRSHEPTPSQKEYVGDYFEGYDDPNRRRNSAYESAPSETPPAKGSNAGGGFGPSASPLFATHVARQPQPQPAPLGGYPHQAPGRPHLRPDDQNYMGHDPRRRAQGQDRRHYSQSPADSDRRPMDRRYESPRRARFDEGPPGGAHGRGERYEEDGPPPGFGGRRPPPGRGSGDDRPYPPPSSSDVGRQSRPKMTRFAGPEDDEGLPPDRRDRRHSRPRDERDEREYGRDEREGRGGRDDRDDRDRDGGRHGRPPRPLSGVDGRRYVDPLRRD